MGARRQKVVVARLPAAGEPYAMHFLTEAKTGAETGDVTRNHKRPSVLRQKDLLHRASTTNSAIWISSPSLNFAVMSPGIRFGEEFEHQQKLHKSSLVAHIPIPLIDINRSIQYYLYPTLGIQDPLPTRPSLQRNQVTKPE
jgi:hypothetical protein